MKHLHKILLTAGIALICINSRSQTTQWGTPTGNVKFPKENYVELPDPVKKDLSTWNLVKGTQLSWGSTDIRYNKGEVPAISKPLNTISLKGWRGERVYAQAVIWSNPGIENMTFEISPLKGKGGEITGTAAFVRYVMQDNFLTCGYRKDITKFDSTLIADPIDHLAKSLPVEPMTSRPVWVNVWIPQQAVAGDYKGTLTIKDGDKTIGSLTLNIKVLDRTLPEPKQWSYHLDFWQNPFAEARYEEVEIFSQEHFELMRPGFERLRDAGQKVITTTIMYEPWNGQTEDWFMSMVSWTKKANGTWSFDFTMFDMWVEYMMEIGIDQQIDCYSMIPWSMTFRYYDQATTSMKTMKTTTDSPEYSEVWTCLLKDLSKHLREKGWFDKTCIAMDERPAKAMQDAFRIIKAADPEFKVSLAGNNHPEIEERLYDYCTVSEDLFSPEVIAKRKAKGQKTTYYTCCGQKYPNMFTYSPPAESEWISWFAAAEGYDGYLRWAYNSYTKEPLLDARFRTFQAGDTYLVYPRRTSIRFEKFVEGVQAFEKIRILREEFTSKGDVKSLKRIDDMLSTFKLNNFEKGVRPEATVNTAKEILNSL